jgi:hypothetical protein
MLYSVALSVPFSSLGNLQHEAQIVAAAYVRRPLPGACDVALEPAPTSTFKAKMKTEEAQKIYKQRSG